MPIVLEPPIVGLAGGHPDRTVVGTGLARPGGIEYLIEFGGIVFNDVNVVEKIRVMEIGGLDDADVRDAREANPSYHGETAFDAWYGGRTITLTGRIEAHSLEKLRDMQMAIRQAFSVLREQPLIFRSRTGTRDTFLMARKSAPIAMRESQPDQRFFRDFLITLRASNPRFLDYSRQVMTSKIGVTNLAANPSFETSTVNWTASANNNDSFAISTEQEWIGTRSLKLVRDTDGMGAGSISGRQSITNIAPGDVMSVGVYSRPATNPRNSRISIEFISATNTILATHHGNLTQVAGEWVRPTLTTPPAPAGTVRMNLYVAADGVPEGEAHYVDAVMAVKGSTLPDYFDGDSDDAFWTGLPHESTSKRLKDIIARPINFGNFRSQPLIRINGGLTNPSITNMTSDPAQTLRINGTIAETEYLDIDIAGRKIEDNTGTNRFEMLDMSSDWMELEPGENVLEFDADASSGDPQLTVFFRDTWM